MDRLALQEFAELDLHRLDHDWTFDQLAAAMTRAGMPMSMRTLHYLLKRCPADARPLDRTLHKIRRYLDHVRATDRLYRARRRAHKAAASA